MTVQIGMPETQATADAARHPLEPLSAAEIAAAVGIVRASGRLGDRARFASITLHEPSKETVLGFRAGDADHAGSVHHHPRQRRQRRL